MAQALRPELYGEGAMRDTFGGRFEMTALHGVLVMRRLRKIGPVGEELSQETFNAMFNGFDDALREIGTGDLSVGRKMRKMGEAFYGRAKAYDAALADESGINAGDEALVDAIRRNTALSEPVSASLAKYVRKAAALLDRQADEALLTGEVSWPRPALNSGQTVES
ncbi:ubiquinol-cytochrome C chaperone [bacterium]|nr:ubiquinol-cytochrome C chaperone [bacterium]